MKAVLLMAYGTPDRPEDVQAYFTHIRGGRTPSPEAVTRLRSRYALVGGRTPLLDITNELASRLEQELRSVRGEAVRVYVGMKHWHPFIGDVVPLIAADNIRELVAVALAPHYSRISIGGYRTALGSALALLPEPPTLHFIDHWHLNAQFIEFTAARVAAAIADFPAPTNPKTDGDVVVMFSAHSLPARIREWSDPYESELLESCAAVAGRAGVRDWRFAWQSAGQTGEPWLGPDIVDYLDTMYSEGVRRVLSVPIGFVSDHLEVMYDIDYEARRKAESLGMTLRRTRMPNADSSFVRVLASVVATAQPAAAPAASHAAAPSSD